ncbi:MAG TPA: hypothetical protein VFX53_04450 [Pedococcus sp.]|nr:hypothetical protein [Pedococcus sp.]
MAKRLCGFIKNITRKRTFKETVTIEVEPNRVGILRHRGIGGGPFDILVHVITAIFEWRDDAWMVISVVAKGPRLRNGEPVGTRWPEVPFKQRRLSSAPQRILESVEEMRPTYRLTLTPRPESDDDPGPRNHA